MFLNKYFKLLPITIICTAIIFTQSCNPLTSDWTYTLKGRILKDCSMKPYANYSVNFYIPGSAIGQSLDDLGTVITDENGYFELKNIPNAHSKHINMKHDIDGTSVDNWGRFDVPQSLINQADGGVYDLGVFYGSHSVKTLVKLTIDQNAFQSTDSIFVGFSTNNYKVIYPIVKDFIYTGGYNHYNGLLSTKDETTLQWGVGKKKYDSIYNELIDSKPFEFKVKLSTCTYPDTTYYSIP